MINRIDIEPGGMLSDVVPNKLGKMRHQLVQNLRMTKEGLWETVKGYKKIFEIAGFTQVSKKISLSGGRILGDDKGRTIITGGAGGSSGIRAAIEITEDESGDRFVLYQDGWGSGCLKRLNWNNGYEGQTPETLALPSGVTIGDTTLRFFYFRGVVRIAGGSEPMWYGYVKNAMPNTRELIADTLEPTYSVTIGREYIFIVDIVDEDSTGTDSIIIQLGSQSGVWDYYDEEFANYVSNVHAGFYAIKFTATSGTLYTNIVSADGNPIAIDLWELDSAFSEINRWYLKKTKIECVDIDFSADDFEETGEEETDFKNYFFRPFSVYDKSQYSLMGEVIKSIATKKRNIYGSLVLSGSGLKDNFPNERLSGFGVCVAESEHLIGDRAEDIYYVMREFDFSDTVDITYTSGAGLPWVPDETINMFQKPVSDEDKYLRSGTEIVLKTRHGRIETIVAHAIDGISYTNVWVEPDANLSALCEDGDRSLGWDSLTITVKRRWIYDPDEGYKIYFGADLLLAGNEFYDFADLPPGVKNISPNYSHWAVASGKAYCNSLEDEEADFARYSPDNQFDVFPETYLAQTEVGDSDSIIALISRDDRIVMMKRKSISQHSMGAAGFRQDVGFLKQGLYSSIGFIVIDNTLYFMDKDDIYSFDGTQVTPVMMSQKMRTLYRTYVSETSFMLWDKLNQELMLILNQYILVFRPQMSQWYVRNTDIKPVGGFLDEDNDLIIYTENGLFKMNHEDDEFDEKVGWKIVTDIFDFVSPEKFKSLEDVNIHILTNEKFTLKVKDPNEAREYEAELETENGKYQVVSQYPYYLFNEMELTLEGEASDEMDTRIKKINMMVDVW